MKSCDYRARRKIELRSRLSAFFAVGLLLATHVDAGAREASLPLRFDHALVRMLLVEQVFIGSGERMLAYRDDVGCNYLMLSEPAVSGAEQKLRVRSKAKGQVATAIGNKCLVLLEWSGFVETDQEAELDSAAPRVRFRTVDSRLLDSEGEPAAITGVLWDWVKRYVHPRIDTLSLDLGPALQEIRLLLPLMLVGGGADRTRDIIDSLALTDVAIEENAIVLSARLDVPDAAAAPARSEAALTPEELASWNAAWQSWDAFLTFIVKFSARDTEQAEARASLRDVLLSARYDIVEILEASPEEPDPVPELFVQTWGRLAPVLRNLQTGLPGETAIRYLSFIAAGDALESIQAVGPGGGLDLSADGLRRMARIIAPAEPGDPLARDLEIDPELRSLMGFGPAIAPPHGDAGGAWWFDGILRRAHATVRLDPVLVITLNQWVPSRTNAKGYLPLVEKLLKQTAEITFRGDSVPTEHHRLFHDMLLATAWKESCWRQYIRKGGEVETLRSVTGALGMMQVNPHAWRGFYDLEGLADDIGYNSRAGADILAHYFTHYAIRKREDKHGIPDALVRATYAVYNGGPSHRRRYRLKGTKASLRAIDKSFYQKYLTIKAGDTRAVLNCYTG